MAMAVAVLQATTRASMWWVLSSHAVMRSDRSVISPTVR
jgi:hypothetical protein